MEYISLPVAELYAMVRRNADPRTRHWPMLYDNHAYVLVASALYLLFVTNGPKVMKTREAFNLRWFMIIYNAFLVGLSVYMTFEIWYSAYLNGYNPVCQPYNSETWKKPGELRMAKALWWYFISKLIEFIDTILMVLRKKNEQITFLHVFHHVSMLNIWWFSCTLIPGGQSWLSTSANSFVHIIMYSYYFLNLFPSLRKHLWWKKYITKLQLTQFVIILVHTANTYTSGCEFPLWSVINLTGYMFIMLILFGNFYYQAYTKGKRLKPDALKHSNGVNRSETVGQGNGFHKKTE